MDISLLTSLYRSEAFIQSYSEHILRVADEVKAAGFSMEIIIIANDATANEQQVIKHLAAHTDIVQITPVYVERETLYASWNRGMQYASGQAIGIWNVDDVRTSAGLIEGCRRISKGDCKVIDFRLILKRLFENFSGQDDQMETYIDAASHSAHKEAIQHARLGPFFMFSREIYDQVGAFDDRFRISGDYEWQERASHLTTICTSTVVAGTQIIHNDNLSQGMDATLAENNIVYLMRNCPKSLELADPEVMRTVIDRFDELIVSPEIAEKLWGEDAQTQYDKRKHRQQTIKRLLHPLRKPIGMFIDKTGQRRVFNKIVKLILR